MKYYPALFLMLLVFVAGCSTPPEPATPTTFPDLCTEQNVDKRVSIEGYFRLPSMFMVSDTALLDFFESPDGEGQTVDVSIEVGTGPNQMEDVPDDFSDDDLKVHTSDNQIVGHNDKVVVAGTVYRYADSTNEGSFICFLTDPVTVERVTE